LNFTERPHELPCIRLGMRHPLSISKGLNFDTYPYVIE